MTELMLEGCGGWQVEVEEELDGEAGVDEAGQSDGASVGEAVQSGGGEAKPVVEGHHHGDRREHRISGVCNGKKSIINKIGIIKLE